ncbi:MAG: fumarylacetoacetate hydrolase family protein [Parvibaculum sp.]|nr:fumarylacetoacetate hydrolase family protein [Parvibaculum sp.]|tara:strand:- start:4799 stop:5845 length:1047 start_codon:yes stop_codon:yes gene_type:complete
MKIAPHSDALTFARARSGARHRLILVSKYAGDAVTGVDLTAALGDGCDDPVTAYAAHGYEGLRRASSGAPVITVTLDALTLPVTLTASHIAVGTNFPEHAKESTVTDGPFLFPKEVEPTPFNAPIPAGNALLDYEVELCFVALTDVDISKPVECMGIILCNDVTDRATLMRHIDPRNITSGKGFTTGKSAPAYLPVGNLFVIPRDLRAFITGIELRLTRNGVVKQSARQSEAIWGVDQLLSETLKRQELRWDHRGQTVRLAVDAGVIPARTGILAGTPEGTIFKGLNKSAIPLGLVDWVLGGWSKPVTHWIVERHIAQESHSKTYLQAGDRVCISVEHLGELRNVIAA